MQAATQFEGSAAIDVILSRTGAKSIFFEFLNFKIIIFTPNIEQVENGHFYGGQNVSPPPLHCICICLQFTFVIYLPGYKMIFMFVDEEVGIIPNYISFLNLRISLCTSQELIIVHQTAMIQETYLTVISN